MMVKVRRNTRAQERLAPLPFSVVRKISFENYLSLAAMRSGNGTAEVICVLSRALYMLFYMCEGDVDIPAFLEVEATLEAAIHSSRSGRKWRLDDRGVSLIKEMLSRFDEVLANVPVAHYRA